MKHTIHPFLSDTLLLSKTDMEAILRGELIVANGLQISLEPAPPKPDYVKEMDVYINRLFSFYPSGIMEQRDMEGHFSKVATMALTFDGETNKLKSAEVLE